MKNLKKTAASGRPKRALPEIVRRDSLLRPYLTTLEKRVLQTRQLEQRLTQGKQTLEEFASGHEYYGLHRQGKSWIFREWAPNASAIFLIGTCNNWAQTPQFALNKISDDGTWELELPENLLHPGELYKLLVCWPGGSGERLPAYARRVVQDPNTKLFSAEVTRSDYAWKHPEFRRSAEAPRIYEAHVGMAQEEGKVGSYREFQDLVLPRIIKAGYNTIQLMAIQEHPYYGSFGYHVSNFFAASSRFGSPEDLKSLIDAAHGAGLAVIMDLVHSHAVRNELEGLSCFDGTDYQYFHSGGRGLHTAWDSRCFNYAKPQVLHFLLSNCRFWLDEYHFDGFRFDGITSILYHDHGLGRAFTSYDDYFNDNVDEEAIAYLALSNQLIHALRPDAITIAEDMSGMPGLGASQEDGGVGFDYRLAMGIPDHWIKIIKHLPDEAWHVSQIYHELTNRRQDEKTISYSESHDQALVGDQTLAFRLIGPEMYTHMSVFEDSHKVDRGIALLKMLRLMTLATAGHGYLNFMGNEFGHPEWIDFPREGNNWSYHYARRQWHLQDDTSLRYRFLGEFDRAMMSLTADVALLDTPGPDFRFEHCEQQTIGFERAGLLFTFNFSPHQSYQDYAIPAAPGKYRLLLDSDAACFGGYARLAPEQTFFTQGDQHHLKVYLPTRTAVVLQKID
jgi:1,4-alpha-glucan branching enzyme